MTEMEKNFRDLEELYKLGMLDAEGYAWQKKQLEDAMAQAATGGTASPTQQETPSPSLEGAAPPPSPVVAAEPPQRHPDAGIEKPISPPHKETELEAKPEMNGLWASTSSRKKVELKNLSKVYKGGMCAVDNVNMAVGDKEFVIVLGPPGCGKTALLNMIAGYEEITNGEIMLDGERMNDLPARDRSVAMVAQDYAEDKDGTKLPVLDMVHSKSRLNRGALSFQMTAYDNMAYDLRNRKVPKHEIDKRINDIARILDIDKMIDRKLTALSLGQKWLVALGRAIVFNPKLFLFDDPISGIDANNHASTLRAHYREQLVDLHRRLNATTIYATSDQDEANLAMADRIIVMKDGKIQQ